MASQIAQIENDQEKALGHERSKQGHDTEVPDMAGVEAGDARGALGQEKSQQNADGSQGAIGRDEDCADVEEDWMHLSKDTASGVSGVATEGICRKGRIRPTGPWLMRW